MRTTLTLDDDVAAKLAAEARKSGRPFKDVVNTCLRLALNAKRRPAEREPFAVKPRPLGALPGVDVNNVEALLDQLDGPARR